MYLSQRSTVANWLDSVVQRGAQQPERSNPINSHQSLKDTRVAKMILTFRLLDADRSWGGYVMWAVTSHDTMSSASNTIVANVDIPQNRGHGTAVTLHSEYTEGR